MNFNSGDLLFLQEKSGALSEAIADVTCRQFQVFNTRMSHMGIVHENAVFESRERVRKTELYSFLSLSDGKFYSAQLSEKYQHLIPQALHWIENKIGIPFNNSYLPNEMNYSCSELVAEAFRFANQNRPVFEYRPMYFGETEDRSFQTWKSHFDRLKIPMPIGKLGISPLGIYLGSVNRRVHDLKAISLPSEDRR